MGSLISVYVRAACTWDFCTMQMMQKQAVAGPSRPKVILFLSTNGITRLSSCSTEPLLGAISDPNVLAALSVRSLSSGHVGLCRVCPVSPRL